MVKIIENNSQIKTNEELRRRKLQTVFPQSKRDFIKRRQKKGKNDVSRLVGQLKVQNCPPTNFRTSLFDYFSTLIWISSSSMTLPKPPERIKSYLVISFIWKNKRKPAKLKSLKTCINRHLISQCLHICKLS